jgi:hypothetical protein
MTLAVDLSNDKSVKIFKCVVDGTIEGIDQWERAISGDPSRMMATSRGVTAYRLKKITTHQN